MATTAENSTGFSFERCQAQKLEGLAAIRMLSTTAASIAMAVERLDVSLQSAIAIRTPESQNDLMAATKHLGSLLGNGGAAHV